MNKTSFIQNCVWKWSPHICLLEHPSWRNLGCPIARGTSTHLRAHFSWESQTNTSKLLPAGTLLSWEDFLLYVCIDLGAREWRPRAANSEFAGLTDMISTSLRLIVIHFISLRLIISLLVPVSSQSPSWKGRGTRQSLFYGLSVGDSRCQGL